MCSSSRQAVEESALVCTSSSRWGIIARKHQVSARQVWRSLLELRRAMCAVVFDFTRRSRAAEKLVASPVTQHGKKAWCEHGEMLELAASQDARTRASQRRWSLKEPAAFHRGICAYVPWSVLLARTFDGAIVVSVTVNTLLRDVLLLPLRSRAIRSRRDC